MPTDSDNGWDIDSAIRLLRGTMDPYLWQQGQELYSRGAVEDFAIQASGDIQVRVLDPRDARIFHVLITKSAQGRIRAICRCPYQLSGHCRHQVVAFEYLKAVGSGEIDPTESKDEEADEAAAPSGSVLYRLFDESGSVSTQTDGSLLRVVLHSLGSSRTPHRASLHLYTGTGWTALRTADVDRWIGVPLASSDMRYPVSELDIARWAQAMHNPNPLFFDADYAAQFAVVDFDCASIFCADHFSLHFRWWPGCSYTYVYVCSLCSRQGATPSSCGRTPSP